ncbi:OmpA family protein [Flectobacillus major]|uniref:OmpA family protein n=1 Tax=Flectobacillus major TaxID=103 RepID=UPI0004060A96|nr:OmpA family protein [Flectobacillus major]
MIHTYFINRLALVVLILISTPVFSQNTHWTTQIIEFSSNKILPPSAIVSQPTQAQGIPPIPANNNALQEEYLVMMFDTIMPIRQVAILENQPQGSIKKVIAIDYQKQEHVLFEVSPDESIIPGKGKLFNIILPKLTPYNVQSIKLFLNAEKISNTYPIEAIGISNSPQIIQSYIRVAADAPQKVIRENLGKTINSKHQEFAPVISSDGNTLYYTRNYISMFGKEKDQDIWYSTKDTDGNWNKAKSLGIPLNTDDNNAVFALSSDGREILLMNRYLQNGKLAPGISRSRKTGSNWSFPEEVKIENFYNYSPNAEFSISADGNVMVMSIQRMQTVGKRDLYVSFKKSTNEWTEPKHMGNTINTHEHDVTPFLAADGKTLYFSTRGFPGFGDNDIFKTTRLDNTWLKWTTPENLGPAINTPFWDGYFTLPASSDYAYMCSYNTSSQKEDIFRLLLPQSVQPDPVFVITGEVLSTTDQKAVECDIEMITDNNYKKRESSHFDPTAGLFKFILPLKQQYEFVPVKKGYLAITDYIDLSKESTFKEIKKNFYLLPLEVGNKGILNSLTFERSLSDLQEAAYKDLDRIAQAMQEIPSLEILFEGHTDNQGDFQLNLQLSETRVKNAKNYLVGKGIAPERIQTKGWGQTRPIASNATEERRKLNRRVEFTVIKR